MKKSRFLALITALVLFSACSILTPATTDSSPAYTPTPDQGQPDSVARAFLDAWSSQNYAGMYSLLSPNSQKAYTPDELTTTYSVAAKEMTLRSLKTTLVPILPTTETSAQFTLHVAYDTIALGIIERDLTMSMVFADNRWGVVWSPSLIFPEMANDNMLQLEVQAPPRANIYDRNGLAFVAADAKTVTIEAVPGEISITDEDSMLDLLSNVLRLPKGVIKNNYSGLPADQIVALGDADPETVEANLDTIKSYPGLYLEEKTSRRYFNALAPHVMGYTSYISQEQLAQSQALGYPDSAIVGSIGLEKWGEQYLAGTRGGTLSAYDSNGAFVAEIASREFQPAQSLYTTLDRNFQQAVQDTLIEAYQAGSNTWTPKAGGAAIVVLDVHNGNVLAMASYPDFDPNIMNPLNNNPRGTPQTIQELLNNPLKPFLNRATQGQYPAGSIFKMVTSVAAYENGIDTPDSTYTSIGYWDGLGAQNRRYDWKKDGHGTITFAEALTESCDSCFYQAGLLLGQEDPNIIPNTAREFGFGNKLGIQIDEDPGLIPDPAWLKQTRGQDWSLGDSVNIAIGQGDVLVTPLQAAVMMVAIANDGTVYRPQFVDHIGLISEAPSITFQPEEIGKINITPEHLKAIQESLHKVTSLKDLGTAEWRLGDMEIAAAGKTGTAQVSGSEALPIAWFAGYAPYDKPEIAVVVMVENAGQGSAIAAPIWRRVIERYFNLRIKDWPGDWADPEAYEICCAVKSTFGDQ